MYMNSQLKWSDNDMIWYDSNEWTILTVYSTCYKVIIHFCALSCYIIHHNANSMMMHILWWHVQETDVSQTLLIKQPPWWWTVWWWWDELILMMMYTLCYRPWWRHRQTLMFDNLIVTSSVDEQLDQEYWCLIWQWWHGQKNDVAVISIGMIW